jgi:hypothetical protein
MNNSELTKSEAKIQADSFLWFHNKYVNLRGLLYHVPNGEKREPVTAMKLKAMGLVPGIPDIVFHYKQKTHFFEFKKPKTGKASDAQKEIHDQLERQGFTVWLPESVEEFQELIKNIVDLKNQLFTNGVSKIDFYYKYKVFSYLYDLGDCELVLLDTICNEESKDKFVHCVSEFMNENYDLLDSFDLLFTPDFKAIYKKVYGSNGEITYKGANITVLE